MSGTALSRLSLEIHTGMVPARAKERIMFYRVDAGSGEVRASGIEKLQGRTWESLAIEVAAQTGIKVDHMHAIRDGECIGHWDAVCGTPSSKWFGEQLPVQFDEVVMHEHHD